MMKKTLLVAFVAIGGAAHAQPWEVPDMTKKPVRLETIKQNFEARTAGIIAEKDKQSSFISEYSIKEGGNYHFSRWYWYWERHTDEDGYMVSPMKALENWNRYQAEKGTRSANKTTNLSDWSFQGPDSSRSGYYGIGRINTVAFHPTDTNTFWIGSGGGGAWKTTNAGVSWSAINDNFKVLGMSDIDFNPMNPNTIYLCTGDRDASDTYSIGVLKSTDGGVTWDTTGLQWDPSNFRLTNELIINPVDTNSLTLATSSGIYKSYNGGQTWRLVISGHVKHMVAHPTDTAILYASTYSDGSSPARIIRTENGGAGWYDVLSLAGTRRIALAVTPANPRIVKAIAANTSGGLRGIYSSSDTGKTFTQIFSDNSCTTNILATTPRGNACAGQGWYDLSLAISPIDSNLVIVGGVNSWHSTDGGNSWQITNQWTSQLPGVTVVHADKHFHAWHPLKKERLFECNDGGIYFTDQLPGGMWNDITNGMGITQFYRNAVSNTATFVLGGAQDNGSKRLDNGSSRELTGGDGMDCHIDPTNPSVFYTSIQYGDLRRTTNGGNSFSSINNIPGDPQGEWITPFLIRPDSSNVLLAGYRNVYMSRNRGNSWTSISPAFSTNIKRLAVSPVDVNYIYAQVNNDLQMTRNGGQTWQALNIPYSGTVSDVQAHPRDTGHIWVTFSGYNNTSNAAKVAQYKNGTWTRRTDQLPNIPVNCLVIDSSDLTVYIGTDFGVFYQTPSMTQWEPYNNNLPSTEVIDLGINYTSGELWAATYGRGMWKSPKNIFIDPSIINTIPLAKDVVTIYPNPGQGRFEIRTDNSTLKNTQANVRIMNASGAMVWQQNVSMNAGGQGVVDATTLPAGMYFMHVNKGNLVFAKQKIVIYK